MEVTLNKKPERGIKAGDLLVNDTDTVFLVTNIYPEHFFNGVVINLGEGYTGGWYIGGRVDKLDIDKYNMFKGSITIKNT